MGELQASTLRRSNDQRIDQFGNRYPVTEIRIAMKAAALLKAWSIPVRP
jgi:hypothetical protein